MSVKLLSDCPVLLPAMKLYLLLHKGGVTWARTAHMGRVDSTGFSSQLLPSPHVSQLFCPACCCLSHHNLIYLCRGLLCEWVHGFELFSGFLIIIISFFFFFSEGGEVEGRGTGRTLIGKRSHKQHQF